MLPVLCPIHLLLLLVLLLLPRTSPYAPSNAFYLPVFFGSNFFFVFNLFVPRLLLCLLLLLGLFSTSFISSPCLLICCCCCCCCLQSTHGLWVTKGGTVPPSKSRGAG